MKELLARCVALLCTVACVTVAVAAVWPTDRGVRSDDRNGDGRPDTWRRYDNRGQLTEVDVDSNFDGRSDIQEYYDRGVLVRRESDRNFNDQVDLVEEFDAVTHEHIRSIFDVDYDGTADFLVLFHDGRPVFSEQTDPLTVDARHGSEVSDHDFQRVPRDGADHLAPLGDPFDTDTAVRGTRAGSNSDDCVVLSTADGLPTTAVRTVGPLVSSTELVIRDVQPDALTAFFPRSPRGPPLS